MIMFLLLLFLPTMAAATVPTGHSGLTPKADIDVWIDGWGAHHWWWTGLDTSDTIYVDVQVTSGGAIDFFICDEANWDIWDSGGTADVYSLLENRGSVSVTFNVPDSGTWHVVFSNDDLFTQKHIEGYIGLSPLYVPSSLTGPLAIVIMLFVAIVISGVIWEGFKRTQQPKVHGYPPEMLPRISQEPVRSPVTGTSTNFCPYCGTPKQSLDSKFCANCGRAFDGPSLG